MKNKIELSNIDMGILEEAFHALKKETLADIENFRNRAQKIPLIDIVKESEHLNNKLENIKTIIKNNFPEKVFNHDDIPF